MEKALELLRILAETVGQTVEALWPEVVAYHAVAALVPFLFWFGAAFSLWVGVFCYRKQEWFAGSYDGAPTVKCIFVIAAALATLIFIIEAADNIPILLQPVGYTVQQILGGSGG